MILTRIQEALRFWRIHLLPLLLVSIPFAVLASGAYWLLGSALVLDDQSRVAGLNVAAALATLVIKVLADGAVIAQLGALQGGRPRPTADCLLFGLVMFPPLAVVELLSSMAVSLGVLMFVLPGLWVFVRLSLAGFAVALERQPPLAALRSSVERTRDSQWIMLGSWLLLLLFALSVTALARSLATQTIGVDGPGLLAVSLVEMLMRTLVMVLLFRFYVLAPRAGAA